MVGLWMISLKLLEIVTALLSKLIALDLDHLLAQTNLLTDR